MGKPIVLEKKGNTAVITLNRPEKKNAIDLDVRQALSESWVKLDRDNDIRSVIITGGEQVFSSGQDLAELSEFREKERIADLPMNNLKTFGSEFKKPVVAAISGHCLGTAFLLTLVGSDIRIASNTAIFGMPEVRVGIPPSLGIPPLVAMHFTPAIAMELLLLGKNISAGDAYRGGYVNKIVKPEKLLSESLHYADHINASSPLMTGNVKEILRRVMEPGPKDLALSNAICKVGRNSEDYLEGPRALREKRQPEWKGR